MKILLLNSKKFIFILFLFAFCGNAQCPSTGVYTISSNINWTAIPGIGTCSSSLTTANSTFNGNVNISYSSSSNNLTFNVDNLTINGNLDIQSTASGNIFTIAPNTTLTIIGDLGDPANNNISYQLGSGSVLIVTGTLYGKNGNTIGGTGGTVSAGSVNFAPGDLNCSTGGCPVLNITNCNDTGTACTYNNMTICTTNYGGSISGTQSGCSSPFNPNVLTLSGHNGRVLRWEKSINNGSTWTGLDSVSTTYDPPSITQTTIYRAVILNTTSGSCISYSNTATVTVSAVPVVAVIAGGSATVCVSSTTPAFTNATDGGAWSIANGTGTASITAGGIVTGLTAGTVTVVYTVTSGGCSNTATKGLTVNILPTAGLMSNDADNTFCAGTSVTFIATGGTNYNFKVAGSSVQNGATASYTTTTLTNGQIVTVDVTNASGCVATSSGITNTVNALPTAGLSSSDADNTFCAGTSVIFTASGGTNYNFKVAGSSAQNGAAATYATTTLTNGQIVTVDVTNASGCVATSSGIINTVNASPSDPLVGTITDPTCALPTGSVVLSGLPASGTWTLTRSPGGLTTSGTGTNTTISGLAAGTYTYTVTNASGCISPDSANVGIKAFVLVENTWNGSAWSTNLPPTAEQKIIFAGDYPPAVDPAVDIVGCSCQVNALTDVIIKTGHKMTITNEVSVDGFLTFENDASLVQINNVTNFGEIDYIRTTDTGIYNTDYVYWSSPVEGMTLGKVSNNLTLSDKYYSYEPTATGEDWKQESSLTPMVSGNGYIIRGPETSPQPGLKYTATFSGVPHNGHYEITPIFADKSYLLGNPYPSALDANTFLANNAAVLNGTLYFWTHNTDMQARELILSTAGSGAYAYTSNDYATYNATGGVGAAPDSGAVTSGAPVGSNPRGDNNANPPSGKIASGQGFFASSKTTSAGFVVGTPIVFDNTMRVGVIDILEEDNSQFFKTRNPTAKTTKTIEKNRIWLNLTNTQGAFKQTLIGYVADATNDYDSRFDGESFDGNEFVDFYSVNQEMNLVIQGRALPFDNTDEVPLGYRTTINGDFTINIDQTDGLLINQSLYLEDKLTKTVFDLKTGNYTFNTVAGTFNDRFVLRYKDNSTAKILAATTFDSSENKVLVSNKNKQIKINSFAETIDKVTIYDLLGRQIYQKENVDSNEFSIANLVSSRQTLVVKVMLQNGNTISKKIIY